MSEQQNIVRKFVETAKRWPNRNAIRFKSRPGEWYDLTWKAYLENVEHIAGGLLKLGVQKGDRIAILSNTRYEWALSDMAILGIGGVTVPIYPNCVEEDIDFILKDSKAQILILENEACLNRFYDCILNSNILKTIIMIDLPTSYHDIDNFVSIEDLNTSKIDNNKKIIKPKVISWEQFYELGSLQLDLNPKLYQHASQEIQTDDVASIIYTSGTTGTPKGVVLTHANALSEVSEVFPLLGISARDISLTFLPFAHILGRIEIWGHALIGYTIAFAESIEKIKVNLQEIKPTVIVAVPRIFEKIRSGILAQADISPVRRRVLNWALSVGKMMSELQRSRKPVSLKLALEYRLARQLVFNEIHKRLGGRLRFAFSGGAPLSPQVAEFFHAVGLLIIEGYGLTETTAAITVNTPFDYCFGTVGKPIGDVKIKIAPDGEILVRSLKVMKEYHQNPEATRDVIDQEGWFHTGDIGEITKDGYLRITDRKKDLIKTAGGKYVAPQRLEGLLKSNPYISNVHIHGDQKKYVVALVTLNFDRVVKFARDNNLQFDNHENLSQHPRVRELIRQGVAEANSSLASFESVKNFAILPTEFSIEKGEVTPSLKVKRKVIDHRYHEVIRRLYSVEH